MHWEANYGNEHFCEGNANVGMPTMSLFVSYHVDIFVLERGLDLSFFAFAPIRYNIVLFALLFG